MEAVDYNVSAICKAPERVKIYIFLKNTSFTDGDL